MAPTFKVHGEGRSLKKVKTLTWTLWQLLLSDLVCSRTERMIDVHCSSRNTNPITGKCPLAHDRQTLFKKKKHILIIVHNETRNLKISLP